MTKNNLREKYEKEVLPALAKEFSIDNVHAGPKIEKIVVNMGTRLELRDSKRKEQIMADLALITGQKPRVQRARVSVAGFGLRSGMPVGLSVTLRRERMWSFLEKIIRIVLPRLRDFRGVSKKSFDGRGNYSLGFSEYSVFPEVDMSKLGKPQGLEMTIVISGGVDEQSFRMLELLGFPFEKT